MKWKIGYLFAALLFAVAAFGDVTITDPEPELSGTTVLDDGKPGAVGAIAILHDNDEALKVGVEANEDAIALKQNLAITTTAFIGLFSDDTSHDTSQELFEIIDGWTLDSFTFDVGGVSKTEFSYLNGVTSALQTQIDGKVNTLTYNTSNDIDGSPTALAWGTHYINDISSNADVGGAFSGTPSNGSQIVWSGNVTSGPITFDFPTAAHRTGAVGTADQVTLENGYNFLVFEYLNSEIVLTDSGQITNNDWLSIELSAQSTDIITGEKAYWVCPYDLTITSVRIDMGVAPVGSTANFDIEQGGTTIFSTPPTIDASETSTATAATASALSDASHSQGDILTFDIDQIGSSTAGQWPLVTLTFTRTD